MLLCAGECAFYELDSAGARALVVDDLEMAREALIQMLMRFGLKLEGVGECRLPTFCLRLLDTRAGYNSAQAWFVIQTVGRSASINHAEHGIPQPDV